MPSTASLGSPLTLNAAQRGIIFASNRTGNGDIYVVDPSGGPATQLTSGAAIDAEPEWSPSGDKIVFSSTRSGNVEIFVMNANGTGVVRLTTQLGAGHLPGLVAGRDQDRLRQQPRAGGNWDIYVMNANGTGVAAADDGQAGRPASDMVAGRHADRLHEPAHGRRRHLHDERQRHVADPAYDERRRRHRAGLARDDDRLLHQPPRQLQLRDLPDDQTGTSQTRLTNLAGNDVTPAWSPDGAKLTFASNRPPGGGTNYNIFTMNPTAPPRRLS